jgi:hypothetical protein
MLYELENKLWDILKRYPSGVSEYNLLRLLQNELEDDFGPDLFRDELKMYRAHFLLFHALYRLSDYLVEQRQGKLDIHVLKIIILPSVTPGSTALSQPDPLRAHYLNLNNLKDTSLEDVKALLGQFWTRYLANEKQAQALQILGLSIPVTQSEIEDRYRRLAMQHHPDKGGDSEDFVSLQQAVDTLRQCGFSD